VPVYSITNRLQHITVLNHIIEILATGDYTRRTAIIRPQRIPVRNFLPNILLFLMGVDIVTTHLRQFFGGFIELSQTIKRIMFFLNQVSTLYPRNR
jgi:hypothetical protein